MLFSDDSDITLVVTSCGRFDLLEKTLRSFDSFNTAPIKCVLLTEDSGDEAVINAVPEHWRHRTRLFVNRPKLGQLASIDLAYSQVETSFIFHCEDDWEFYRPGFIEVSRTILNEKPDVLQVWLRSFAHDIRSSYPFHSLGERFVISGQAFYRLLSTNPSWQGFSFNPGLRRLSDYQPFAPFARFGASAAGEEGLSRFYAEKGFYAVVLESDAVLHTGDEDHVWNPEDEKRVRRKQWRKYIRLGAVLGLLTVGFVAGVLWVGFNK